MSIRSCACGACEAHRCLANAKILLSDQTNIGNPLVVRRPRDNKFA